MLIDIFNQISVIAPYAHFLFFFMLLLAGFCVPISEELIFFAAAFLSSKLVPDNTLILFFSCFAGALISDLIGYALGRKVGRRLLTKKRFLMIVPKKSIDALEVFYEKNNVLTIVIGRFFPAIRNLVFITAGVARMNLFRFVCVDVIACVLTSLFLFSLGRIFASNIELLVKFFSRFQLTVFFVVFVALVCVLLYLILVKYKRSKDLNI